MTQRYAARTTGHHPEVRHTDHWTLWTTSQRYASRLSEVRETTLRGTPRVPDPKKTLIQTPRRLSYCLNHRRPRP